MATSLNLLKSYRIIFSYHQLTDGGFFGMRNKKCYISLPITGRGLDEVRERIAELKRKLEDKGFVPVSPFDRDVDFNATHEEHMREDFKMLLVCDYILMGLDWEHSVGCRAELNAALACGIKVMFENSETI